MKTQTKTRRRWYNVGINKMYFPPDHTNVKFTAYVVVVCILAESRTDAARIAWEKYGQRWLSAMRTDLHPQAIISLDVNDPSAPGNGGLMGRCQPIKVHG